MSNNKKININKRVSQSLGLDIALILSKLITGKSNLHYGIWDNLEVNLGNLCVAQEAYTRTLFGYLPKKENMKILDIGGGGGETARELLNRGHEVDIIIPSKELSKEAKNRTEGKANIFETTFEDYAPKDKRLYDVCLFSESFQYIPINISLPKASALLNKSGIILISDCFRSEAFMESKTRQPGGGHDIVEMEEKVKKFSLNVLNKIDITQSVSPSIDLEQKMFSALGEILLHLLQTFKTKRKLIYYLLKIFYSLFVKERRRKDIKRRLFSNSRTSKLFITHNKYMIFKLKPSNTKNVI